MLQLLDVVNYLLGMLLYLANLFLQSTWLIFDFECKDILCKNIVHLFQRLAFRFLEKQEDMDKGTSVEDAEQNEGLLASSQHCLTRRLL